MKSENKYKLKIITKKKDIPPLLEPLRNPDQGKNIYNNMYRVLYI